MCIGLILLTIRENASDYHINASRGHTEAELSDEKKIQNYSEMSVLESTNIFHSS